MRKGPFTMWESDEDNYSEENDGVESDRKVWFW